MRFVAHYEVLIDIPDENIDTATTAAEDEADQIRGQIKKRTRVGEVNLKKLS